jgi:hypothetical protein
MDELLTARKKAESAVQDMADGDLKTKAFEVFLRHLLSHGEDTPQAAVPERRGTRKTSRAARRVAGGGGGSLPAFAPDRILSLKDEGFFKTGRGMREIRDEMQAHGWMYKLNAISGPLMKLVRQRQLRRATFSNGNKKIFKYFNP